MLLLVFNYVQEQGVLESHRPHEQRFFVAFYYVADAIIYFKLLAPCWIPSFGPGFMIGSNNLESTLF